MSEAMREIGSKAWWATYDNEPEWIKCLECAGSKHLRVLMPDDTILLIDCVGCASGYEPPKGVQQISKRVPRATIANIIGMEITSEKTVYRTSASYLIDADKLFDTEAEALAAAHVIAEDADRQERERIYTKEKPTRSWSWHVHYHRQCIRRAEEEITRHSARLGIARVKAKTETP